MGRSIGAVFVGLLVTVLWIAALEWINSIFFPWPDGLQRDDREAVALVFNEKPAMLVGVAVVYFVATVIGSWFGSRIGRRAHVIHGSIIGMVMLGISVMNLLALPHPVWFWVVGLAEFPVAGVLGGLLAKRNAPALRPAAS